MSLASSYSLIEQGQLNILNGRLEWYEIERLEDEAYHPVAVFGSPCLAEIDYGHAIEQILASVIVVEDADDVEQSRFARPRRPHYGDEFSPGDVKVNTFQHMQRLRSLISLVDVFEMYHLFLPNFIPGNGIMANRCRAIVHYTL